MGNKIAIIGHNHCVEFFSLIGLEPFPCKNSNEARKAMEKIDQGKKHALTFIVESLAYEIKDSIKGLGNYVLIPDHLGSSGLAQAKLAELIRSAIGQNLNLS